MHVEVSEGFRKTIADIVDCCVELVQVDLQPREEKQLIS